MSTHVILPHKPDASPASASDGRAGSISPPPPPANSHDPTTITRDTDQFGTVLFVNIPGYGRYTPDQLIACLEAREALGQARADAAALEVRVQRLLAEMAALKARLPVLEAAAGVEVLDEH